MRAVFDRQSYELVFSDEFNTSGRTFNLGVSEPFPPAPCILMFLSTGDYPFWEAVDIWYSSTNDLE
jgi:hypothetical protein